MARLSDLPVEILDMILEYYVDPKIPNTPHKDGIWNLGNSYYDMIWALRLTCRALCIKFLHEAGRFAFHTLRIYPDPRTILLAQQVCHDPIYAPAIKKVIFAVQRPCHGLKYGEKGFFFAPDRTTLLPFANNRAKPEQRSDVDGLEPVTCLSTKCRSEQDQLNIELKRQFAGLFDKAVNLSDVAIEPDFRATFVGLPKHIFDSYMSFDSKQQHLAREYIVPHEGWRCNNPTCQPETFRLGRREHSGFCTHRSTIYAAHIFDCIATSIPGRRLKVFNQKRWPPNHTRNHYQDEAISGTIFLAHATVFANVTRLNLTLCTNGAFGDDTTLPSSAFNSMTQLAHLEFRSGHTFRVSAKDDYLRKRDGESLHNQSNFLRNVHFPKLKTLMFHEWKVKSSIWNKFLAAHKHTIEHLEMCRISIAQERIADVDTQKHWFTELGCWYDIFTTLRQFSKLEKFWLADFDRLAFRGRIRMIGESWCLHAEGRDEVIRVLKEAWVQADTNQDVAEVKEMFLLAKGVNCRAEWGGFKLRGRPWAYRREGRDFV